MGSVLLFTDGSVDARTKIGYGAYSQGCVAQMLSVETDTITNWELNRNTPHIQYVPKILEYLGYTPLFDLAGNSLSKRLEQFMYVYGLTQKECARRLGVDSATISRTLNGKRVNNVTLEKIVLSIHNYC